MARSKAYPGVPLSECVDFLRKVKKAIGKGPYDRNTIADAVGLASSTIIRLVAALVHFGLLERAAGGYAMTGLGEKVCSPLDGEFEPAVREALYSPALYRAVLDAHRPSGALPRRLSTLLHRNHGITDNAAEVAAKTLIESAVFAGVIDEAGVFQRDLIHGDTPENDRGSATPRGAVVQGSAGQITFSGLSPSVFKGDPVCEPDEESLQDFRFRLPSGRFARLCVPGDLTKRDIELIRKQVELLELQLTGDAD